MGSRRRVQRELDHAICGEVPSERLDALIAALAARQYGVVSRVQLLAIGLTARMIEWRLDAGRLHVIHRGVYAVGHTRIPQEGRWLAAVLACGAGAVLSHRSAGALWGIRPYSGKPEVIAPHAHRRGRLLVARRSLISPDECTQHRGIRCTTPERTLVDLAKLLEPHQIDRAVREAEFLQLADFGKLREMLEPRPRGTKHLRIAIERAAESLAHTRSDLEDRFRTLVLDEDLPAPEWNKTIELDDLTIEADVVWRGERVVVELDGYDPHRTRSAFTGDRRRDRALQLAGWLVLRYTWTDLNRRELRRLSELLNERRAPRSGRPRSAARRA
jgi:very-short-patch-repair endonuclease